MSVIFLSKLSLYKRINPKLLMQLRILWNICSYFLHAIISLFYLQVEVLEARHLVEAVEGDVPDVVVAQIQGLDAAQAPEGLVGESPEVEGVGELEVADRVAHLPKGVVRDVLDPVVGLKKKGSDSRQKASAEVDLTRSIAAIDGTNLKA